jgi:two-component system, chemotaxis family, chemotaxis protein CheY
MAVVVQHSKTVLSDLKVLIVDDQRTMRSILRQLLGSLGIKQTFEAENGELALEFLTDTKNPVVDAIICDVVMEKMDGMDFCNAVRRSDLGRIKNIPILMLTAMHDDMIEEVLRQVGAADIAHKPISAPELAKRIERLVGIRAA